MNNSVSIAIPTYNNDEVLDKCLKSLSNEYFTDNYKDIIIVSNGPRTNADYIVKKNRYPVDIKHVHIDQASVSIARNKALEVSASDLVLFFDNDMTFNGTTLAAYAKAIDEHGKDHFYGGPVAPNYELAPPAWLVDYLPRSAKLYSLGSETREIKSPDFLGGNHAVPRLLTLKYAKYDLDGIAGQSGLIGEETRTQKNLLLQDVSGIYVPDALAFHYVPSSRCSPEWVLHRNYRTGFTAGRRDIEGKCAFSDIPCWVIRRTLSLYVKLIMDFILRKEKQTIFKTKYDLKYYRGIISSKLWPNMLPDAHWKTTK